MTTRESIHRIYDSLLDRFGHQHWWPGETPFEIIVGAILTQNTNWTNVEKALNNLKAVKALDPQVLYHMPPEDLAEHIRPAGYFRVKTKRLRNFLAWLFGACNGQLDNMAQRCTVDLREEILAINGIGPETADSILLYALDRPVFVVDAYTARIAVRHGLIEAPFGYDDLQALFQSNCPEDVQLFNEYHALLVRAGKENCRPKPLCETCPLNPLPHTV